MMHIEVIKLTGTPTDDAHVVHKQYVDNLVHQAIDVTLFPEFHGSVLYADGSGNAGSFISGYETSGNTHYTYYQWTADSADQHGEIISRVLIPSELVSWRNPAITFELKMGVLNTDKVDLAIYKQGSSSPIVEYLGLSSGDVWGYVEISDTEVSALAAGDEIIIRIKCISSSGGSNYVKVGKIKFSYQT